MPEARLQRTRGTLPSAYQFGDGAVPAGWRLAGRVGDVLWVTLRYPRQWLAPDWRAPHDNAAEQIAGFEMFDGDFHAGEI
jgi:hypothetical protein